MGITVAFTHATTPTYKQGVLIAYLFCKQSKNIDNYQFEIVGRITANAT